MIDWLTVESVICAYKHKKLDKATLVFNKDAFDIKFQIDKDGIVVTTTDWKTYEPTGKLLGDFSFNEFDHSTEKKIERLIDR